MNRGCHKGVLNIFPNGWKIKVLRNQHPVHQFGACPKSGHRNGENIRSVADIWLEGPPPIGAAFASDASWIVIVKLE